jgi:hypothetical protein
MNHTHECIGHSHKPSGQDQMEEEQEEHRSGRRTYKLVLTILQRVSAAVAILWGRLRANKRWESGGAKVSKAGAQGRNRSITIT